MLSWTLFRHYLFSSRSGSLIRMIGWVCIAGVTLSVFSLTVVVSVMNGFNRSMKDRLLSVEPHLVVDYPKGTMAAEILGSSLTGLLKGKPDVQVHLFESQDVILRTQEGTYGDAEAKGLDEEALEFIFRESQRVAQDSIHRGILGNYVSSEELARLGKSEVLLGVDLARQLGVFEGDSLTLVPPETLLLPPDELPRYETVTVAGIVSTRVQSIDSRALFYLRGKTMTTLADSASRQVGIEIRLRDPERFEPLKREIAQHGFSVSSWVDRNSALFLALKIEKATVTALLTMSALIAGSSILTVLLLLITQKGQDIGVLMALGLSRRQIQRVFTKVGLILSGLGIGVGLVGGLAVCYYLDQNPLYWLPDLYYESKIPVEVDYLFIFVVLVCSLILSFFGSWIPTRRQISYTPAEAMRQ